MIIVRVELHSARTGEITQLGWMNVSNTGKLQKNWPRRADYDVEIMSMRKGVITRKVMRKSRVRDYPRLAYTVWELVRRALECSLGKWPIHPGRPEEFDELVRERTFEEAWKATGYCYGSDALEQVRLGWELAHGKVESVLADRPACCCGGPPSCDCMDPGV